MWTRSRSRVAKEDIRLDTLCDDLLSYMMIHMDIVSCTSFLNASNSIFARVSQRTRFKKSMLSLAFKALQNEITEEDVRQMVFEDTSLSEKDFLEIECVSKYRVVKVERSYMLIEALPNVMVRPLGWLRKDFDAGTYTSNEESFEYMPQRHFFVGGTYNEALRKVVHDDGYTMYYDGAKNQERLTRLVWGDMIQFYRGNYGRERLAIMETRDKFEVYDEEGRLVLVQPRGDKLYWLRNRK